jgi:hypothetical protein
MGPELEGGGRRLDQDQIATDLANLAIYGRTAAFSESAKETSRCGQYVVCLHSVANLFAHNFGCALTPDAQGAAHIDYTNLTRQLAAGHNIVWPHRLANADQYLSRRRKQALSPDCSQGRDSSLRRIVHFASFAYVSQDGRRSLTEPL